jgi:hypothetical protein
MQTRLNIEIDEKKYDLRMWTEFIWLELWSSGRLCEHRLMILRVSLKRAGEYQLLM